MHTDRRMLAPARLNQSWSQAQSTRLAVSVRGANLLPRPTLRVNTVPLSVLGPDTIVIDLRRRQRRVRQHLDTTLRYETLLSST